MTETSTDHEFQPVNDWNAIAGCVVCGEGRKAHEDVATAYSIHQLRKDIDAGTLVQTPFVNGEYAWVVPSVPMSAEWQGEWNGWSFYTWGHEFVAVD